MYLSHIKLQKEGTMDINLQIGIKLKALRESKQYSLEDVAKRVGKARQTIHKYENGMISIAVDDLQEILDIYEITVGKFLDEIRGYE